MLVTAQRWQEAGELYKQICKADPADADAWFMFGVIHGKQERHAEAVDCLRRAVELRPGHAESRYNLGIALREQGDFPGAVGAFQATLKLKPDYADAQDCLAHALLSQGKLDEAAEAFHAALRFYPTKSELHSNLGSVHQTLGQLSQAEACYREAQRLKPGGNIAFDNLGSVLTSQGRIDEALKVYREGVEKNSGDARLLSNLLLSLNYIPNLDPRHVLEEHMNYERACRVNISSHALQGIDKNTERPLRIGYVSPDFREHSVTNFFEPLLACHNHDAFRITCYSDMPRPDATTERLRNLADVWRETHRLNHEKLAQQIRADGIDILVDLAGHTANNRLPVFAIKPAPIQVTYLGYPNTTGLSAMDYRLTDLLVDPEGQEKFYTEKLLRLPGCFLCYQPPADVPAAVPFPCRAVGFVTFGSFNNLAKVNDHVIELWSEILRAVPTARLMLKNHSLTDPDTRERHREAFMRHGIARERLELIGHTASRAEHLALYGRMDIALDTFPYNGTTTTCEALWMGVPVITLAGQAHSGRVALSLLSALQLQELGADSAQGYVALAVALANDQAKLIQLHATLRERMQRSPLCNGRDFAHKVEMAYRELWCRFCEASQ